MAERIPPHSDDAERSVLGAALQNKQALYDVMESLDKNDFYREYNGEIFDAMAELYLRGETVDIVTAAEILKKRKRLNAVGGSAYLGQLSGAVPSPSSARQYANIIREKTILRELIGISAEITTESYADSDSAADVLERAERAIMDVGKHKQGKDFIPLKMALDEANRRIEALKDKKKGQLTGLASGFRDLDAITSGLQPSDLIVLAARPGKGKTSFALNIALHAAVEEKATVLVFSLEMSAVQLGQRLLSAHAQVPLSHIRDGSLYNHKNEIDRVKDASVSLVDAKIYIDDTSGISINEMKNKCRRLKTKEGLDLIIVDYLQLMDMSGVGRSDRIDTRALELAMLTRMLKQLARELDCPVILLSQLNRAVESRHDRKPMLSDLRDTGAIEQDADIVLFIYNRDEGKDEDETGAMSDNMRQLLIAKHRNGETGEIDLVWLGAYTRFRDGLRPGIDELPDGVSFDEDRPW